MVNNRSNARDDDSANAVQVDLDNAKQRLANIETPSTSPDQLGQLIANAVANSTPLRRELGKVLIELFGDHDTREEVKKVFSKIDREIFWRWAKYVTAFVVGGAT